MLWRKERRHPTWDREFEGGVMTLRAGANAIGRWFCALRFLTDPPVGSIPLWLPTLPESVGTSANVKARTGGEWFFPATGHAKRGRGIGNLCCADWVYPGDPQDPKKELRLDQVERVVLYFHGGAFCLCTAQTHRALLMRIVEATGAVCYAPDYRRPPEHPWPAPVDDCLDAYRWLLEQSVQPCRIVFAGDSAGGGLVLAVLAAARAAGLPMPAGGAMYSPWLDLTDSASGSWSSNQVYDFLPRDWAVKFAKAYAGERSLREVSPGSVSLEGLPPLLIEVGECECLRDQILAFIQRGKAAGLDIEDHLCEGMVHVFPLFAAIAAQGTPPHLAFERLAGFVDRTVGLATGQRDQFPARCVPCRRALTYWKHFTCSTTMIVGVILIVMLLVVGETLEERYDKGKEMDRASANASGTHG
eukprot:COSAG03_NODE_26_length_19032_cov_87.110812_14_plen_416_part_00